MAQQLLAQHAQLKEQLKPARVRLKEAAAAVQASENLHENAEAEVSMLQTALAAVQEQPVVTTRR